MKICGIDTDGELPDPVEVAENAINMRTGGLAEDEDMAEDGSTAGDGDSGINCENAESSEQDPNGGTLENGDPKPGEEMEVDELLPQNPESTGDRTPTETGEPEQEVQRTGESAPDDNSPVPQSNGPPKSGEPGQGDHHEENTAILRNADLGENNNLLETPSLQEQSQNVNADL